MHDATTTTFAFVQWPFFQDNLVSQHHKGKARVDGLAVASAGPYANDLHLAADR